MRLWRELEGQWGVTDMRRRLSERMKVGGLGGRFRGRRYCDGLVSELLNSKEKFLELVLRYLRRKEKEHRIFTRLRLAIWTFRIIMNGWTTMIISVRILKTAIR